MPDLVPTCLLKILSKVRPWICLICRIYAAELKAFKIGGSDVNVKIFFVAAAMAWGVGSAHADVFRCTGADGKTVYQESPCATGAQKALDDRDHRQREKIVQEQKAEADRKSQQAADLKKQWAACQADKSCVDLCYGVGERLATVYIANFQVMAQSNLMASEVMAQGCEKEVGELSSKCVDQCQRGFKLKARSILKR